MDSRLASVSSFPLCLSVNPTVFALPLYQHNPPLWATLFCASPSHCWSAGREGLGRRGTDTSNASCHTFSNPPLFLLWHSWKVDYPQCGQSVGGASGVGRTGAVLTPPSYAQVTGLWPALDESPHHPYRLRNENVFILCENSAFAN